MTSASYNLGNRLTAWTAPGGNATPIFDANGNMTSDGTRTVTRDSRNRLIAISGTTASFTYDAHDRRSTATLAGTTTGYLYDGTDVVQELSGTTPTANLLTGLGIDQRFTRTAGSTPSTFLTDNLGSPVALADAAGVIQTSYVFHPG